MYKHHLARFFTAHKAYFFWWGVYIISGPFVHYDGGVFWPWWLAPGVQQGPLAERLLHGGSIIVALVMTALGIAVYRSWNRGDFDNPLDKPAD